MRNTLQAEILKSNLPDKAKLAWIQLATIATKTSGRIVDQEITTTTDKIGAGQGCSRWTAWRAITALQKAGLINVRSWSHQNRGNDGAKIQLVMNNPGEPEEGQNEKKTGCSRAPSSTETGCSPAPVAELGANVHPVPRTKRPQPPNRDHLPEKAPSLDQTPDSRGATAPEYKERAHGARPARHHGNHRSNSTMVP